MDHRIHSLSPGIMPLPHTKEDGPGQKASDFKDILRDKQTGTKPVKVSKHASDRLQERGIEIDEHDWKQISEKMGEAKQKGVTDSLVMINNTALLVSTKNNTVVTAMNQNEAANKIFTNINGAIVIDK